MPRTTPQQPTGQHPVTYDQPLPGHYPILTLQLNITRYQDQGLGKMVLVVREPSSQIECFRSFIELQPWEELDEALDAHVTSAVKRMVYLQMSESFRGK